MKEAHLKRLHTVWFQPYDILEKEKSWDTEKISDGQRLGAHRGFLQLLCSDTVMVDTYH